MALATATSEGAPSVRMVLLKGVDERGLVFYSHYTSRKGRELEANPQAALLFHWSPLGRQVRVEGRVEHVWQRMSRTRTSRRGRATRSSVRSPRGRASRSGRERSWRSGSQRSSASSAKARCRGRRRGAGSCSCRTAWEFWQHRASRLHDRFRYEREPSARAAGGSSASFRDAHVTVAATETGPSRLPARDCDGGRPAARPRRRRPRPSTRRRPRAGPASPRSASRARHASPVAGRRRQARRAASRPPAS